MKQVIEIVQKAIKRRSTKINTKEIIQRKKIWTKEHLVLKKIGVQKKRSKDKNLRKNKINQINIINIIQKNYKRRKKYWKKKILNKKRRKIKN